MSFPEDAEVLKESNLGNVQLHDKSEHQGVKYQCYYMLAQGTNDLALCGDIPDTLLRDGCLSDIAALRGESAV